MNDITIELYIYRQDRGGLVKNTSREIGVLHKQQTYNFFLFLLFHVRKYIQKTHIAETVCVFHTFSHTSQSTTLSTAVSAITNTSALCDKQTLQSVTQVHVTLTSMSSPLSFTNTQNSRRACKHLGMPNSYQLDRYLSHL